MSNKQLAVACVIGMLLLSGCASIKDESMKNDSSIYFAYRNYINVDYNSRWGFIKQLIKKYNVDERRDRITTKYVTEDIEKSNILIKKGYYVLSFNNSKVSSIGQIKDFYLHHTGIGCDVCFDTGSSIPKNSYVNVIMKNKDDIIRIAKHVELKKANISKEQIVGKIKFESRPAYIKKQEITDLLILNKDFILVKGTLYFSYLDGDVGDEYPYFGVLFQGDGTLWIKDFKELLDVLLIVEKYYFVTYWQEPDCGKRGLIIYTVEGKSLKEVFTDYSEAT